MPTRGPRACHHRAIPGAEYAGKRAGQPARYLQRTTGHLLFGNKTHVDAIDGEGSPQEILCDEFARHLLIPQEGVRAWLDHVTAAVGGPLVDERTMALLARHFGASPKATRIQIDRMGLLYGELKDAGQPTGRRWAYRYGWGPQFDSDQAAARQPRVPRRILDRAIEAYREGKLGIEALAHSCRTWHGDPDPGRSRTGSASQAHGTGSGSMASPAVFIAGPDPG
jgi:hypothetical protein